VGYNGVSFREFGIEDKMFNFKIKNNPAVSTIPYVIETEGHLLEEEVFNKTALCWVNDILLVPSDRIVIEGKIPRNFPVIVHKEYGMEFRDFQSLETYGSVDILFSEAGIPDAEYSTWRITLAWDGCDLGVFPFENNPELKVLTAV